MFSQRQQAQIDVHFQDKEIRRIVETSGKADVAFIVVATPVEEIGRDHDFDWSVVEPSSTQSIVQVAGRVNRHRLVARTIGEAKLKPNVLVLDFNYNAMVKSGKESSDNNNRHWPDPVFRRPGFELTDSLYKIDGKREVSLRKLLGETFVVDARLRFRGDRYAFARLDDESIKNQTDKALGKLYTAGLAPSATLVAQAFYEGFPLRDREPRQTLRLIAVEDSFVLERRNRTMEGLEWEKIERLEIEFNVPPHPNAWLAWDIESLVRECNERGLKETDGLRVETRWMDDNQLRKLRWDASFGWHQAD